ncbi:MAG: hypothetical protein WCU88_07055 [Elusimicrobiota bacterium]|jgi:hypothetical protein
MRALMPFGGRLLMALGGILFSGCMANDLLPAPGPILPPLARVVVLPVKDRQGLGPLYVRELRRGLPALGLRPASENEPAADAVLEVSIDCGRGRRSRAAYALRPALGQNPFFEDDIPLKICGSDMDVPGVAEAVLESLGQDLRSQDPGQ